MGKLKTPPFNFISINLIVEFCYPSRSSSYPPDSLSLSKPLLHPPHLSPSKMTRVLVLGGSGNVGKLVLQQLLGRSMEVRAIIRTPESLPNTLSSNPKLSVIKASLLHMSVDELASHVQGCDAVICTLGHGLNYGRIPAVGKFFLSSSLSPPWCLFEKKRVNRVPRHVLFLSLTTLKSLCPF